jgi:hypothetical protein
MKALWLAGLLVVGCGGGPEKGCEVADALISPTTYEFGAATTMSLHAVTEGCGAETFVTASALMNESAYISLGDLRDDGTSGDAAAGDGTYDRTIQNQFYGNPDFVGSGVVRFLPCDPDCQEPAFEVAVTVTPAP